MRCFLFSTLFILQLCVSNMVFARSVGKDGQLLCYSGFASDYLGLTVLAQVPCDGQCSSFSGVISGDNVTSYNCIPANECNYLGVSDSCLPVHEDREITACCCNNANTCVSPRGQPPVPTPKYTNETTISCYSGIFVNKSPITPLQVVQCQGQCSSTTFQTTSNNVNHSFINYGCTATSVCDSLNLSHGPIAIEPGVLGYCCNSDYCIDPLKK
ncbi:hypothetical protein CAEBREN_04740 [Caenorhabditis brenneri]|uniref:ET module n=1 Tax=Caenorhabditis brenneri TaxID=135651 RepID=G0M8X5_CAEBE|nr:hypothetical protein CAEBREN_04740 [Caenorhabditis brenneri]